MIDFENIKKLFVNGMELRKLLIGKIYHDLIPSAIDIDQSIYQGVGYIEGYRLNSTGALTAQAGTVSTGFIPCVAGDIIRVSGANWRSYSGSTYISFFDSNFGLLGSANCYRNTNYESGYVSTARGIVLFKDGSGGNADFHPSEEDGVYTFDQLTFTDGSEIAYFRINGVGNGKKMIVTVNEEIEQQVLWSAYENLVPKSINADGTAYNNGLGYKNGYRVRSGGAEMEQSNAACTGYIPVKGLSVVRVSGCEFTTGLDSAINVSDASFTNIGQVVGNSNYGIFAGTSAWVAYGKETIIQREQYWEWVVPPEESGVAYIRVTGAVGEENGKQLIVTVDEEIY